MTLPLWVPAPVRVMPFGDDRVVGDVGADTFAGWRFKLEEALDGYGTLCGPTRDSPWPSTMKSRYHGGVAGLSASTAETSVYGYVTTHQPRLIVLGLGTVDLADATNATTTLDRIDRVIALAYAARPALSIIWLTPTPLIGAYAAYDAARLAMAAGMPARVTAHQRLGRDVVLCEAGEAITNTATMMATDLNPNPTGYEAMGTVIGTCVQEWRRLHGFIAPI